MMSLTFERWYPAIYAVAGCAAAWLGGMALPNSESYQAGLLSAAISASSIFVGFVATSKSILMALPPGGIKQQLRDSEYKDYLAIYLNQAMTSNLAFCALNIAGFFPLVQHYTEWFTPLWVGVGIFCLTSFWRVGRVMTTILRLS